MMNDIGDRLDAMKATLGDRLMQPFDLTALGLPSESMAMTPTSYVMDVSAGRVPDDERLFPILDNALSELYGSKPDAQISADQDQMHNVLAGLGMPPSNTQGPV